MNAGKYANDKSVFGLRLILAILALISFPLLVLAQAPQWWTDRGVLVTGTRALVSGTNDYAAVNQGQVKNIAVNAVAEMEANLPGGAGDTLHSLATHLSGTTSNTNDYAAVNLGQLKNFSKPFYDRLLSLGYQGHPLESGTYPWVGRSANDYAMANIGQVKNLFSFDLSVIGQDLFPQIISPANVVVSVNVPFNYTITATNNPTAYNATGFNNGALPSGLSVNTATGIISGTLTTPGIYGLVVSASNNFGPGSDVLLIDAKPASSMSAPVINSDTTAVATAGSSFAYMITASNGPSSFGATNLPGNLAIDPVSGIISGTATTSGTYSVNLSSSNVAGTGTASLLLTVNSATSGSGPVPVVTSSLTATGAVGQAFSYTIAGTNNPTSFNATGLPAGLTLSDTTTGIIAGTPTVSGTFTIPISIGNSSGTAIAILTLTIAGQPPAITSPLAANGAVGVNFYYAITANNNPTSFSADGLPTGLVLNAGSGEISGTFVASGTYTVALTGSSSAGNATANLVINVDGAKPVIMSATTASAIVGTSFYYNINAANTPTSYSTSGLPQGLELDPVTGDIRGKPLIPGIFSITLSATNSFGTATAPLTLTVASGGPQVPAFAVPTIVYAKANTPFPNRAFPAVNNPSGYAATGLPAGLTIDAATGLISGTTPAIIGTYLVNLSATNPLGTGTAQFLLVLESTTSTTPASIRFQAGVSPMDSYQTTAATIQSSTNNISAATITSNGLTIGNPNSGLIKRGLIGFDLSLLPSDATVTSGNLNLYVSSSGSQSHVELHQASVPFYEGAACWNANNIYISGTLADTQIGSSGAFAWVSSDTFISTLQGAVQNATPLYLMLLAPSAEVNLGAGNCYYTMSDQKDNTNSKRPLLFVNYTTASPAVILPGQSILVSTGSAVNYQVPTLHNPTSISASNLPPGLAISSSSGMITGIATTSGTYLVNLTATNPIGTGSGTLTMVVGNPPSILSSGTITSGTVGIPYSYPIAYANGPATFSASGLPDGLTIDASTGVVSGTPTDNAEGSRSITITARNPFGVTSGTVTLNIVQVPPVISPLPDATGNQDLEFNYNLGSLVTHQPTGYSATGLPSGLSISQYGTISGTPSATGTFNAVVTATNATGSGSAALKIYIVPPPSITVPDQTAIGSVGNEFYYKPSYSVNTGSNSYCSVAFSASGLPGELSIDPSDGYISGTAITPGTYSVSLTASYGTIVGTGTLTLTIYPPGPIISSTLADTGYIGKPYFYTLTTASWDAISTSATNLPSWLSFTDNGDSTGTLSGTPTESGTFNVTLSVANASGTNSATLALSILGQPLITSTTVITAQVGMPFTYTITGSNSITGFGAANLPPGLSINSQTGVISGTATTADIVMVTLSGSNAGGTVTSPLLMTIKANPSDQSASFQQAVSPTQSYAAPFTCISSAQPDQTGTSNMLTVGLTSGSAASRSLLAFDLSSLPSDANITSANLVLTSSGSSSFGSPLQIEVHQASSPFDPDTANWSNNSAYSVAPIAYLTVDPAVVSGTNTFYGMAAFTKAVQAAYSGLGIIYLNLLAPAAETGSNANYVGFNGSASNPVQNPKLVVTYTLGAPTSAPVFTSPAAAAGTVNSPFSFTLTATNRPTSFAVSTLPIGLSLNPSTGAITGTPTVVGSTAVTGSATNAIGTGTNVFAINIDSGRNISALSLTGGNNQFGIAGSFAPIPLSVQALNSGTAVPNTLVTFTAQPGMGLLSATNTGASPSYPSLTVPTDTAGKAAVYLLMPQILGPTSVEVSAGTAHPVVFSETTVASLSGTGTVVNDRPVLSVINGANQNAQENKVLPNPFVVRAVNHLGQPVASLELTLNATKGGCFISTSGTGGPWTSGTTIYTNSSGQATVYLRTGSGPLNQVSCSASSSSAVYLTTNTQDASTSTPTPGGSGTPTVDSDPCSLAPPTTVEVSCANDPPDGDPSEAVISWDASPNADGYIIQQQVSGGPWKTAGTAEASASTFTVSGLYAQTSYQFRVISKKGSYQSQPSSEAFYSFSLVAKFSCQNRLVVDSKYTHYERGPEYYSLIFYPDNDLSSTLTNGIAGVAECRSDWDSEWNPGYEKRSAKYKFKLYPHNSSATLNWLEEKYTYSIARSSYSYLLKSYSGSANETGEYFIDPDTSESCTYELVPQPRLTVYRGGANGQFDNEFDSVEKQNKGIKITTTGSNGGVSFCISLGFSGAYFSHSVLSTVSLDSTYFQIFRNGKPVSINGDLDPGSYTVQVVNGAPIGASAVLKVNFISKDGVDLGSDSCKFVYEIPTSDYSLPIDEASGPKYRKIAMNGLPMPDEKPQQAAETDQEKEETFVDALTLGLRHSTTDVHLPVAGSDFAVSARRDIRSEVWTGRNGLRPHEQPDRPFGICWSSNLAPNIHIATSDNPKKTEPDKAYVTDETGAVHTFFIWNDGSGQHFFPMPTAQNEQTPNLESLTANASTSSTTYTFTRKYGATLVYEATSLSLKVSEDRAIGSDHSVTHTYARLKQATDRLGNTVNYQFQGASNLVPATITVANQPDTKLYIQQQPASQVADGATSGQPLITAIWDAKGNKTSFTYETVDDGNGKACELTSVITVDGTTSYNYNLVQETDTTPRATGDPGNTFWHGDLASITDPLGNKYRFAYNIDNTKLNYMADSDIYVGYYIQSGLPRNIAQITLPDDHTTAHPGSDVTKFVNDSKVWVEFNNGAPVQKGQRRALVTDATGFVRTYRFEDAKVIPLPKFKEYYDAQNFTDSKIVCYQALSIDYGNMGTETYRFDINAGMAVKSIKDFSGNTTTFAYADRWTDPLSELYRKIMTDSTVNGFYSDPTSQTNALGKTKSFTYTSGIEAGGAHLMKTITDEEGRVTKYTFDNLGRRIKESIYPSASSNTPIQVTDFEYGNSKYPGFQTKQTIEQVAGNEDPTWVKPLVTQFIPDANGRIAQQIVDPNGLHLVTSYTYDANGQKLSSADPKGNTTWFSYDARNRLITTTFADGTQKQIYYDACNNKKKEADENGYNTLYAYDALNRLRTQARDMNSNGAIDGRDVDLVTSFSYNNANSKTSITDPRGCLMRMDYDSIQRLSTTADALNHITKLEYGSNSGGNGFDNSGFNPTRSTDPREVVTDVTYDALYRPIVKVIKDQQGKVVSSTAMAYDGVGNAVQTTDSLGHQTKVDYDALNRSFKTTYADHNYTQIRYTSTGFKWKTIDENGYATVTIYDAIGRPTYVVSPLVPDAKNGNTLTSATTTTFYDAAGNVAASINPLGYETDFSYDARNRKIQGFRPAVLDITSGSIGRPTLTWQYDAGGRISATIDARGNQTDTLYDAANRVTDVNAPAVPYQTGTAAPLTTGTSRPNTHTTYDANGNVLTVQDPNNHTTTNTYDALNHLWTTTDAANIKVSYEYDKVGNRTKVTDGNNHSTQFAYDALNRNTKVTNAANKVAQFRYDGQNKTKRIDALNRTTTYLYDARNRLKTVVYASTDAANSQRDYAYDPAGNLLSVTEPAKGGIADVSYTFDALNRMATETSGGLTHTYGYDLAGNRVSTIYGGTNRSVDSSYDALNRLSTMTENDRTTTYGYDLDGNVAKKILPNGDEETATFDALKRTLSQVTVSGANQPLYQYVYGYDLVGNATSVAETYSGKLNNRTVTNVYDNINRLSIEAVSGAASVTTAYEYDNANNRLARIVTGGTAAGTTGYTYNNLNQLTDYSQSGRSVRLTYDNAGNRTTRVVSGGSDAGSDTYSCDFENRLISLVKGSGEGMGTYVYGYDYRTRRVFRDESGAGGDTAKVVFSGGLSVQEYVNGSTYTDVEYLRGSDYGGGVGGILYTLRGTGVSYTHENRRGDIVAKTSTSGTLTYQAAYQAYGTRTQEYLSTPDKQKGNSKEEDPTGLLNEGFRYRDLETGVFLTRDPLGFVDGPNLYTYVRQNPWTSFDPEGLSGELTIATQADGSRTAGMVTGAHSWLVWKSDKPNTPVATVGTYGNANGAQHKPGLNTNTELNPKYQPTQTRTMHIDDNQEKAMGQFFAEQQKKGKDAWTATAPCSSFAANGWNAATGEKIDPSNGTTGVFTSTPQNLGEALKKANGGANSATITPSAKDAQAQSQAAAQQAVVPTGNGAQNGNGTPPPTTPQPQKQAPAKPAATPPPKQT